MEITADLPSWLTWIVAGAMGVPAIAALTRTLELLFDLDRG
jgi:hypothetical protein